MSQPTANRVAIPEPSPGLSRATHWRGKGKQRDIETKTESNRILNFAKGQPELKAIGVRKPKSKPKSVDEMSRDACSFRSFVCLAYFAVVLESSVVVNGGGVTANYAKYAKKKKALKRA